MLMYAPLFPLLNSFLLNSKYIFLIIVLLSACQKNGGQLETPTNVLNEEQMVSFLIDLHMTEANISSMNFNRDSSMKIFNTIDESLYSKHQTSDTIVQKSLKYYAQNPEVYDRIYEAVIDSLTVIQSTGIYKP
jgi:hypothetical protein